MIELNFRKNGVLICFVGIDGSGKTSHALALHKEFSNRNINSVYVRPRYALLRFVPSVLRRRVQLDSSFSPRLITISSGNRKALKIRRFLKVPLTAMLFAYAFLTYFLCIRPLLRNSIVVCDRYFFDLFYNLWGDSSLALVRMLPSPDAAFVFDVPVAVGFSRMHSEDDKRISQEYYNKLRRWYLRLARQEKFIVVDSSSDFERNRQLVSDRMKVYFEG
jgi:thymidylate kinase